MLTTNIRLAKKYDYLSEKFKKAYAFLQKENLEELSVGAYAIDGDTVIANVQCYTTAPAECLFFETHDRYFDIQYMVRGEEQFGYVTREGLTARTPYDAAQDLMFYEEPKQAGSILLKAGDFAVVSPEDAHKPRCIAGTASEVMKIVVKIKI